MAVIFRCCVVFTLLMQSVVHANACDKTIYLTFDTGNMSVAHYVAETLKKHDVKATFFLANEKTYRGDYALDEGWSSYWKELVAAGHGFGSHTFFHTYYVRDLSDQTIQVKSQFGPHAGKVQKVDARALCSDIQAVGQRFQKLTGRSIDTIWRAPGGKTSPQSIAMAKSCGFAHIAWSPHGFLGDELSSEKYPNQALLNKALRELRPGDIAMAHLGIWSRKDVWATSVLEPLIVGLKAQGYCFGLIRDLKQHSAVSGTIVRHD